MVGVSLNSSRRTHASNAHGDGSAGRAGIPAANGLSTALTRLDTTPVT
jgi:hypothetical protein